MDVEIELKCWNELNWIKFLGTHFLEVRIFGSENFLEREKENERNEETFVKFKIYNMALNFIGLIPFHA